MENILIDTLNDFRTDLRISADAELTKLEYLAESGNKYIKDLRINFKNAIETESLTRKEGTLIALAIAVNQKDAVLIDGFKELAKEQGASEEEIAEIYACTSLLATNNVFYRFKHFTNKDIYNQLPAKIKMSIMMNPVLGKEFFELVSLAISAVNGCELCVNSHEASLLKLGAKEERVFDAVRLAAVVIGLSKLV